MYELQLLKWLFTILSVLFRFQNPLKRSTFNKRIVSSKNFSYAISILTGIHDWNQKQCC